MKQPNNNMTYEEAYTALEQTVAALEDPRLKIEDSISLYERACRLVVICRQKLSDAQVKVTEINDLMKRLSANAEEVPDPEE